MTVEHELLEDSAEELFEDAPCGYLTTDLDGRILKVNRTFEAWTGRSREQLLQTRFQDLLTAGGRIFYDTNYAPLLQLRGWVREIAVDIVRADDSHLPALVNAVLRRGADGAPQVIRTTIFDATDRRRYERESVRARDREHAIATQLQHSILDGVLPDDERFDLAVCYRPSDDGLMVGGDWYDAFHTDDDTVCVVVGDVVGRGIEAAAAMGQLRSAIRALAGTGLAPGALLDALDAYSLRHRVGDVATVAVVLLDLRSGAMRIACAGHVPPAIIAPGEAPRFVLDGRSAPLAAYTTPVARRQTEELLDEGGLLVLYSDGLIERADRSLDVGMAALAAELGERRALPARQLADELTDAMLDARGTDDDVCLLVLQRVAKD